MTDHDSGYKLLFAHPEMVRDLILEFVPGDWQSLIDFSTLERINASFVSDEGKARHDDMIWRVELATKPRETLYLYLLFEFQSKPDHWMALRLLVYIGLFYQELIRQNRHLRRLPPVLPIVLYNGEHRWHAATEFSALIDLATPEVLRGYLPELRYVLIDEGRYDPAELAHRQNLAAALFRLELARTPDEIREVVRALVAWLDAPEQQELRRTLTKWLLRLMRRRVTQTEIPEVQDLLEVDTMLAERMKRWTREWKQEGFREGIELGIQQGELLWKRVQTASNLRRLLAKRFGPIPTEIELRISAASLEELESWLDRILDAPTLDAVFEQQGE
ncbi:Rpn family recombination-promoting nuclease/putative transposase [Hydrogenophilus islandicus]